MNLRHELKYTINPTQAEYLKEQLTKIMTLDRTSLRDKSYTVRSLYFDTLNSSAFYDKMDGIEFRKKYRIRYYNFDESFIRLECKEKLDDMCHKTQFRISKEMALMVMKKDLNSIPLSEYNLFTDFVMELKLNHLVPSIIIDYKRTAFVQDALDVRITFDEQVSTRCFDLDFFSRRFVNQSIFNPNEVILEVKYNTILPIHIHHLLNSVVVNNQAISKFALGRDKK